MGSRFLSIGWRFDTPEFFVLITNEQCDNDPFKPLSKNLIEDLCTSNSLCGVCARAQVSVDRNVDLPTPFLNVLQSCIRPPRTSSRNIGFYVFKSIIYTVTIAVVRAIPDVYATEYLDTVESEST